MAFWIVFVNESLLPPMEYFVKEKKEKVVFKSFNTNYLNWIFSQEGADQLYDIFIKENGDLIIQFLVMKYNLKGSKQSNDEIHQLDFYVNNLIEIYKNPIKINEEISKNQMEVEEKSHTASNESELEKTKSMTGSVGSPFGGKNLASLKMDDMFSKTEFMFTMNPLFGKECNNDITLYENLNCIEINDDVNDEQSLKFY